MRVILGAMSGCSSDADCDDGNKCNGISTCQSGTCTQTTPPVTCPTPDQCHDAGTCDPTTGTCSNPAKPDSTACNDGNACTQTDTCQAGVCTGSNPVVCQASDQCHVAGTCNPATSQCSIPNAPDGTACTDGNACTQTDICQAGVCTGGNPVTCTALDQCHNAGTCDPGTGTCSNPAKANGTACTDGNACTQTDTCQSGTYTGGNPVICAASDQCHVAGTCNPSTGQCSNPNAPDGTACGNGTPEGECDQPDKCVSGVCNANRKSGDTACTDDGNPCTLDQCDGTTVTCQHPAGNAGAICRTAAGACDVAETCTGASAACPADGFKANTAVCRAAAGVCDVAEQCTGSSATCPVDGFASNTTACDDHNACTTNDHCHGNGHCTGGPAPDVVLHLIKHVVNHDSCTTSPCLNGLVASDFDLTVRVNSTSTIYAGVEAPGTAINLKIGDTFAVTEDLTTQSASQPVLNPGGVQGDISHFYTKRFSSNGCSGVATCNPTTGPQEQTCTVTNDDILLQNQLGIITVTENPWTSLPAVCPGEHNNLPKVQTINGSFHLVNVSLNQPHDVLVANMSVLLEYRDENTGQLTTLVDPATCTFQLDGSGPKVTSFTFTTTQGVSFSCNVSSLPVTTAIDCHDVVKATVQVHLFQRHTTFTTFTASYTRQILQ